MAKATLPAIGLLVSLPPLSAWLESTMTSHMLVQIPALFLVGWLLASAAHQSRAGLADAIRPYRWSLLIVASCTLFVWMIPRMLDLAVERASVDTLKVVSVVVLGGGALKLSWINLGPVARGLVHVEVLATALRVGWIYLESPARLCTQYGLEDQQRLGNCLIGVGVIYGIWLTYLALLDQPSTSGVLKSAGISQ